MRRQGCHFYESPFSNEGAFLFYTSPVLKRIKDRSDSGVVCPHRSHSVPHSEIQWGFLFIAIQKNYSFKVEINSSLSLCSSLWNAVGLFALYPSPKRIVSFKVEINSPLSHLSRFFGTHPRSLYPVWVKQNNEDAIQSLHSKIPRSHTCSDPLGLLLTIYPNTLL